MPAKQILPKVVMFFIADDVRLEGSVSPKPTLLGMYPDNVVVIQMPGGPPSPTKEAPIAIEGLSVLASFEGAQGTFEATVILRSPDGTVLINSPMGPLEAQKGSSMLFVAKMHPFFIPEFGFFNFSISLGDNEYSHRFELRRGLVANQVPAQIAPPKKARAKKSVSGRKTKS